MKKSVKILSVLMAIVLMVAAFAACGENTPKVKVVDIALTEEVYAFGVDPKQPELLKQVNEILAEFKNDGTLDAIFNSYFGDGEPKGVKPAKEDTSKDQFVVATNAAFPPFEYVEGEYYYGIDMELAEKIAEKLGQELVIKDMAFESVCLSVGSGKADIAMAGLSKNPDREKQVTFAEPYYSANQVLIVRGDDTTFDNCKTMEDVEKILKGLDETVKIGGQKGTTGEAYVNGDDGFGFEGLTAEFAGYDSAALAVQDLINGNISYVIIDKAPAEAIVKSINAMA